MQRKYQLMHYIWHGNSVLPYTAFVGNLLYKVLHKMIPCGVFLESFKNFETDIHVQAAEAWTLGEHFDLAQTLAN